MLNLFFCSVLLQEVVEMNEEAKKIQEHELTIKEKCKKLLYKGAKFEELHVLLGLLNLQTIYNGSNVSVTTLFQLLCKILPKGNYFLKSHNEAKKALATLGLEYEGIHAFLNDHVLFRKDLANEVQYPQCGASCY